MRDHKQIKAAVIVSSVRFDRVHQIFAMPKRLVLQHDTIRYTVNRIGLSVKAPDWPCIVHPSAINLLRSKRSGGPPR